MMKYILLIIIAGFIWAPNQTEFDTNTDQKNSEIIKFEYKIVESNNRPCNYFYEVTGGLPSEHEIIVRIPMHLVFAGLPEFVPEGFVETTFQETGSRFAYVRSYDTRPAGYFIPKLLVEPDFLKTDDALKAVLNSSFITKEHESISESVNPEFQPQRLSIHISGNEIDTKVIDKDKKHRGFNTCDDSMTVKPGETVSQIFNRLLKDLQNCSIEPGSDKKYTSIEFTKEHFIKFLANLIRWMCHDDHLNKKSYQDLLCILSRNKSTDKNLDEFYQMLHAI